MQEEINKNQADSVFVVDDSLYHKEIKTVPSKPRDIGIDTNNTIYDNIILSSPELQVSSKLDMGELNKFSTISQNRNQVYNIIDSMCEDSKVSAVLESYAEDVTDYNDQGQIVWCESSDGNAQKYVTYLLDSLNIDKHIFGWVFSLCKYGDIYIRLFHESDRKQIEKDSDINKKSKKKKLNEDIKVKAYRKNDPYINYVELYPNPAEMFELCQMGKTYAYIKADVANSGASNSNNMTYATQALQSYYSFNKNDVIIYGATDFVHATLDETNSRFPEKVTLFTQNKEDNDSDSIYGEYKVRRGKSLLYDTFKTWRNLTLLENSLLLNRLTKSAIIRVISVNVGDMPKDTVAQHLLGIKNMIEQKTAINVGKSLSEYTNPGPIENNIYVPVHDDKGTISTQEIGGNPDVKSIVDIDYYLNQFYGSLRVVKQFFGQTEDAAGFNGGSSLTVLSSRYAKMVKRIQNTMCQLITDLVNLILVDRKLIKYVNNFSIRMQAPATQEEKDRREQMSAKIDFVEKVMQMMNNDITEPTVKLSMLKALLSNALTNGEVIELLQDYIDTLENEKTKTEQQTSDTITTTEETQSSSVDDLDLTMPEPDTTSVEQTDMSTDIQSTDTTETNASESGSETILPTPSDLGVDMTVL